MNKTKLMLIPPTSEVHHESATKANPSADDGNNITTQEKSLETVAPEDHVREEMNWR